MHLIYSLAKQQQDLVDCLHVVVHRFKATVERRKALLQLQAFGFTMIRSKYNTANKYQVCQLIAQLHQLCRRYPRPNEAFANGKHFFQKTLTVLNITLP